MSEKIYALLLLLYPSRFREEYSEEALQLFRDCAHDEKGLVPKLRLWLKMLKRATLVGEATAGVAHSGAWHRIDEHFAMAIPEVRPINPYSKTDWSGGGVQPDVKVRAAAALEAAVRLAENKRPKR